MTARRRFPRTALLALGLLTLTVGGAALSWACTPAARVAVAGAGGAGSVLPGGQMEIAVAQYSKDADVTVYWNGLDGEVLATGKGPEFSATVPVPNVPDGTYTVFSRAIDDKGELRVARAPVIVGEPGTSQSPRTDSGAGSTVRSPAPGSTSGSTAGGEATTRGDVSRSVNGAERASGRTGGESRRTAPRGSAAKPAAALGVKRLDSGQAVFADSIGANTPKAATRKRDGAGATKAATSDRSASGDLWSAFSSGKAPAASLGETAGPTSGPGSGLTLGLGLAGFGLVALMGGVAVAEARRRRLARSSAGS